MKDFKQVRIDAAKGASKGALTAAAASVISGVATASVPIKILGFITVGTSTAVSAPVIACVAVGGAILGGAAAAYASHRKQVRIERQFDEMMSGDQDAG